MDVICLNRYYGLYIFESDLESTKKASHYRNPKLAVHYFKRRWRQIPDIGYRLKEKTENQRNKIRAAANYCSLQLMGIKLRIRL